MDHRTDVYSLGIVLFEMLTGQIPCMTPKTPFAIVLKRITEPMPLPPGIDPTIPEAVERVILKALAKEPRPPLRQCRRVGICPPRRAG